ncbi:unnamed protein product, partial [marine sediment metagenome]
MKQDKDFLYAIGIVAAIFIISSYFGGGITGQYLENIGPELPSGLPDSDIQKLMYIDGQ